MERTATLRTPVAFSDHPIPGQPFDSGIPHCVWHRLLLDVDVPSGCSISIAARASDDAGLLDRLAFIAQPPPYRRGAGCELPWRDPWAAVERPSPEAGTWELLFQNVVGRYGQLEVTLTGKGRSTPSLRALRAWYPRFSYVRTYLPTPYREDDEPEHFLEADARQHGRHPHRTRAPARPRFPPGQPTDDTRRHAGLAGVVGGAGPGTGWSLPRRRFLVQHVDRLYRIRGTIGGLRSLLRLYLGCSLDPDVVFATGARTDDPARIVDHVGAHRFRVLIPEQLDDDRATMVTRIVTAARPAHTTFEVRSYGGLLVVGEGQVGVDTVVGASVVFTPITLGTTAIAAGTLAAAHPVRDRGPG